MFMEMRRKDRQLEISEAEKLLKNCDYGVLSTVGKDGYAYGVPLSYVYINNSIYFHCALEGHKLENIKNNDKVSFCVVGQTCILPAEFSTNYESVIIFGTANEVSGNEKNAVLLEIINKYSPDYIDKGKNYITNSSMKTKIVKINIEHISGKARK